MTPGSASGPASDSPGSARASRRLHAGRGRAHLRRPARVPDPLPCRAARAGRCVVTLFDELRERRRAALARRASGRASTACIRRSSPTWPTPTARGGYGSGCPGRPTASGAAYEAWARLATLMAGAGRGTWFVPEVDDEVLAVFEGGDPHRPYVIGALWNGQDAPPETMGSNNDIRAIHSRNGVIAHLRRHRRPGTAAARDPRRAERHARRRARRHHGPGRATATPSRSTPAASPCNAAPRSPSAPARWRSAPGPVDGQRRHVEVQRGRPGRHRHHQLRRQRQLHPRRREHLVGAPCTTERSGRRPRRCGATALAGAVELDRPAMLRFDTDDFIDRLQANLDDASARDVGAFVLRPETWQDAGRRAAAPRRRRRCRGCTSRCTAASTSSPVGWCASATACRTRRSTRNCGESVFYVLRRLEPVGRRAGRPGRPRARFREFGWVPSGPAGSWVAVGDGLAAGEERLPLFPMTYPDRPPPPRCSPAPSRSRRGSATRAPLPPTPIGLPATRRPCSPSRAAPGSRRRGARPPGAARSSPTRPRSSTANASTIALFREATFFALVDLADFLVDAAADACGTAVATHRGRRDARRRCSTAPSSGPTPARRAG